MTLNITLTPKQFIFIAKGLPILVAVLLLKPCFDFWWQLLAPDSYYEHLSVFVCFPPPPFMVFINALLSTAIIGMSLLALNGNIWSYQTIKWLLIIATPISLYIFWSYLTRLWDYRSVTYTGQGTFENSLSIKQRWNEIYLPILLSLLPAAAVLAGLWLWTREEVRAKFGKQIQ